MAANGHRRPASPSHVKPHIGCSGGTSSLIWPHLATLRLSLILKQVVGAPMMRNWVLAQPRSRYTLARSSAMGARPHLEEQRPGATALTASLIIAMFGYVLTSRRCRASGGRSCPARRSCSLAWRNW